MDNKLITELKILIWVIIKSLIGMSLSKTTINRGIKVDIKSRL